MKLNPCLLLLILFITGINFSYAQYHLIPKPQHIEVYTGHYRLGKTVTLKDNNTIPELDYLAPHITAMLGSDAIKIKSKADIELLLTDKGQNNKDGYYELRIDKKGIRIAAATNKGLFYGIQTLLQVIEEHTDDAKLPHLEIRDYPRFAYRGMHLDVGRHFFSVDEIKKYLDYLAYYKLDKFHWHLTEDQGWRLEIKKYPKLQEIAAWRNGSMVGHHSDQKFDTIRYGGYFTQEQAKEVVAYAQKLHIDVIPEIEMPGHAQAAIAAYPELGCTKEPVEVWQMWGISENIFCPGETTFKFLEDVMDEVIDIFPYEYIHIGGDEAPKKQWKESPVAQEVIKREGLKDEDELQSYFITRMEKYINSKGRQIIGWDEILKGGLAPNATVMSWTGIEGGIHAARTKHKAIMTPTSTNYFDYYQGNPETEPLAIGGDVRLKKVYAYNPVPDVLTDEEAQYIWGTQANLWTEYIPDFNQVEYMIFPRIMALSEVAWGTSNPTQYKEFEDRVISHFAILDRKGINYSRAVFEVTGKVRHDHGTLSYRLSSAQKSDNIRYTTDGSEPTAASDPYTAPIKISESTTVKAAYFEDGKQISPVTVQEFLITKSTGKEVTLKYPPAEAYAAGGVTTLVDGIRGNARSYGKGWLGFNGKDIDAVIDFGKPVAFSNIQFASVNRNGSWIYLPTGAEVSVSDNGRNFKPVKSISKKEIEANNGQMNVELPPQEARYMRLVLKNIGIIPDGSPGAGNPAWLFLDEIAVY